MVYFNSSFRLVSTNIYNRCFDVKLTEEEKKKLEVPYIAQAAIGHC